MRFTMMHPSEPMREFMERYVPKPTIATQRVANVLDRVEQIEGLARLLDQALVHASSGDGRLDLRKMAAFMLDTMERNQK